MFRSWETWLAFLDFCFYTTCALTPGDRLVDAQKRVPLSGVLQGTQDWRAVEALKRSVQKMKASTDTAKHAEAGLLGNYIQKLTVAKALCEENLTCKPNEELRSMIQCITSAGVDLPVNVRAKLVERVGHHHPEKKDYSALLDALSPFEPKEWDVTRPLLGAIGCEEQQLIATFQDMCFQICVLPFIRQGQEGQRELIKFASLCIEKFKDIDIVDLSDRLTRCLSETMSTMKALLAILDEKFQLHSQVLQASPSPPPHHQATQIGKAPSLAHCLWILWE